MVSELVQAAGDVRALIARVDPAGRGVAALS